MIIPFLQETQVVALVKYSQKAFVIYYCSEVPNPS